MSKSSLIDLSVYFIVDPSLCDKRRPEDVVEQAIRGGASIIQFRDKISAKEEVYHMACCLRDVAYDYSVPFVINDYVDIAYEICADGVHIGQGDMPAAQARSVLGPGALIGVTAFTPSQIAAIDPQYVDYIGTGPVYPTQTDKGKPVLGVDGFSSMAALSPVPVVGIGGIDATNAAPVIQSGAHGVAMMRSISQADDVADAAREIYEIVMPAVQKHWGESRSNDDISLPQGADA